MCVGGLGGDVVIMNGGEPYTKVVYPFWNGSHAIPLQRPFLKVSDMNTLVDS